MSTFYGQDIRQFPDQISNSPGFGLTVRRPFRCTPTAAVAKMNELIAAGTRFDHEAGTDGGYQWVIAFYGGDLGVQSPVVPLADKWSLPGNDLEKDIWRHPKVKALFAAFLDANGDPTADYAKRRNEIEDLVTGAKSLTGMDWWSGASSDMKKFVRNLMRGETSYSVSQFVLRNVKVVAENYSVQPAYTYVGKILTTGEIQNGYNPPATIKFALPAGFWLERTPSVSEADSFGRYTVAREWWHTDDYDDFLYDRI